MSKLLEPLNPSTLINVLLASLAYKKLLFTSNTISSETLKSPVALISPDTSKVYAGELVPIPILLVLASVKNKFAFVSPSTLKSTLLPLSFTTTCFPLGAFKSKLFVPKLLTIALPVSQDNTPCSAALPQ